VWNQESSDAHAQRVSDVISDDHAVQGQQVTRSTGHGHGTAYGCVAFVFTSHG
jgi:hypothetical protein